MNIIGLKIPTGRRQTSWLFTSMTEELNWGPPRNNSSLVVRVGLEPPTSGFQVRRPNHSATLPPQADISADISPEMLKLGRVTKVTMLFLVLVFVFNFDLFKFLAAILEKGLFNQNIGNFVKGTNGTGRNFQIMFTHL